VLAKLQAANITIPNELVNDCDPGDKQYIVNATALQQDTAQYIGQICTLKNCSAFISVGKVEVLILSMQRLLFSSFAQIPTKYLNGGLL